MSDVKALFGLIDKRNKRRLIGAVICCVLSVLCGILPYLGVWGIVTCFLDERTENLFQYVCLIAAAIILKHLLFGTGTKISHKVAYQTLGETRKKLFRKIARLPMGYVKTTASGQVKTIIMDNMEQLETFYAHNIPEILAVNQRQIAQLIHEHRQSLRRAVFPKLRRRQLSHASPHQEES